MADILSKLTGIGNFEPSMSYSFEFRNRRNNRPITECFLLLPPVEYSLQQGYRVSIVPTASGGGVVYDFGNDFKKINVKWDIWFYWFGEPAVAPSTNAFGRFAGSLTNGLSKGVKGLASVIGLYDYLSGLDEFFRLRYMLSEGRDLSLLTDSDNKIHNKETDFTGQKRFIQQGMDSIVSQAKANMLNYKDIQIVWHDYDDQNHYEVIIDNFNFKRIATDAFSFTLEVDMTALKPFYGYGNVTGDIPQFTSPYQAFNEFNNVLAKPFEILDNFLNYFFNVTSVISATKGFLQNVQTTVTSFIARAAVNINNIKIQIEELKEFFNPLSDNNQTSVFNAIESNVTSNYTNYLAGTETLPIFDTYTEMYTYYDAINAYAKAVMLYTKLQQTVNAINLLDNTINANLYDSQNPTTESYPNYRIIQGDTLYNISIKFFGSIDYAIFISNINNVSPSDFDNNGMVGKWIKIPIEVNFNTNFFRRNQVFNYDIPIYKENYTKEIENFGVDIKVTNDKKFAFTTLNDLDMSWGQNSWIDDQFRRLSNPEGSLSELDISWGVPITLGNYLNGIIIDKIKASIEQEAITDPRTKSAKVTDFNIKGNQLYFTVLLENVLDQISKIEVPTGLSKAVLV